MTPLLEVLGQGGQGQVWPLARFEAWHPDLLTAYGFEVDVVDLADVSDKHALMGRIAVALDLPEWFGRNWDAVDEALGDRYSQSACVLVLDHLGALARADRPTATTLVQVAADAVAGTNSLVLAVGPRLDTGPLPERADQGRE